MMRTFAKLMIAAGAALFVATASHAGVIANIYLSGTGPDGDGTLVTEVEPGAGQLFDLYFTITNGTGISSFQMNVDSLFSTANGGVANNITIPTGDPNCPAGAFDPACDLSGSGSLGTYDPNGPDTGVGGAAWFALGTPPTGGTWLGGLVGFDTVAGDTISLTQLLAVDADSGLALPSSAGNTITVIPEPATASLLVLGLGGLALAGRRRR